MENIITVDLYGCKTAYVNSLMQWDYGYKLHITGLSDFGGSVEVHFSLSEVGGEAERSIAEVTEDGVIVELPNFLLQKEHNGNYYAYAFIYPATADVGQTVKTVVIPVNGRPRPADWSKKNDPDVIAQLNEKIEKKADKADTLSGYGIKDAYTKTEVDKLIEGAREGYTDAEIDAFLSEKVDKVEGKDLSSNDFTDELKAKLENAASKDDLNAAKTEFNRNIELSEARSNEKIENSAEELREYINEAAEAEAAERKEAIAESKKETANLYANAIKATASGEVIRVDDVSPAEHTERAKVSGKNLIPYPYGDKENSKNGGTFIVQEDGGVLVSGTPTDYISLTVYNGAVLATEGLITVSITGLFDNVAGDFVIKNEQGENIASVGLSLSTATKRTINLDDYPTAKYCTLILKRANNNKEMNGVVYPQIERGDTATEYEPYIDPTTVTVTRCGKNIFDLDKYIKMYPDNVRKITEDSFVITSNVENNTFVNYSIPLFDYVEGKYITVAGSWAASAQNKGALRVQWYDKDKKSYVNQIIALVSTSGTAATGLVPPKPGENCELRLLIYFNTDGTLKNGDTVTFRRVQVEIGDTATEYEPYKETETYTPEADGTVNINSLAPTMTLLTDTAGVNIELEYNQDSNKALGNVKDDIKELDRMQSELINDMGDIETALDSIIAIQNELMGVGK